MPLRWTIGYGALGVAILGLGLESTSTAQEPSRAARVGATVSVTGCLLDERTYAAARGLARVPDGLTSGPQLVLVPDNGGGRTPDDVPAQLVYALTGLNEAKLSPKVGTRVELTGVVEPGERTIPAGANQAPRRGITPGGPVGVTPDGSPAHEQGDAVGGAPALEPTAAATPAATPISLGDLTRLNVQSSRSRGGSCSMPVAAAAPAVVRPSGSQPAESAAPRVAAATVVEVTGCVRRSTDGDGDRFVLDDVSVSVADQRASAVPGSSPSGSGSGTVPATAATPTGTAGSNAGIAFTLVGSGDQLKPHVDRRVRVTGTIDNAPGSGDLVPLRSETAVRGEVPRSDVAHPSAQELRVRTITEAGGGCN